MNLLRIPYPWLVPIILVVSIIGVYSVNFATTDIWIMVISGRRSAMGCASSVMRWRRCCSRSCWAIGWKRISALALTMSGGSYATFADQISVLVATSTLGLLLAVQAFAWLFGYRKSFADEAKGV